MSFGRRRHLLALGLYLLLTLLMTWPLVLHFATAIPGDSFDGWQNYWNLWWMRVALVDQVQWPLVTDLLYAPTGVSLYFHTLNPFNGLASLPVQLTGGLIPAYNFIVLLSFTLSGYGAFLLAAWAIRPRRQDLRRGRGHVFVRQRFAAALLGGAIFAFAPFHMAHLLGHMQVFAYQWVPFTVLFTLRALEAQRHGLPWLRSALFGGLFLALAGLCDWYFVLYLTLFAGGATLWFVLRALVQMWRWQRVFAAFLPATVIGACATLLLLPLLAPMLSEALRYDFMQRPAADLYRYSATVADYLIPSRLHPLVQDLGLMQFGNQVAPVSERTLAVGYGTLLLVLVAAVRRRRAWLWLLAAGGFLLLSLGPSMHGNRITAADIPTSGLLLEWSPYNLVNRLVPFMRISRSVSRFALMVQLCLAVAAAMGLYSLLRPHPRRTWRLTPVFLVVLLAESWVAPYPMSPPDTPAWYSTLAEEAADPARPALLNLPMNYDRPGYLLYQTVHKRPLAVAYISRDDPRTLTERVPLMQHLRHLGPDIIEVDPAEVGPTVLADLGVGLVVLDRYKMPGGLEREYTETVARTLFAGEQPEYADERITVYRTAPVENPVAYLRLGAENWGDLQQEPFGRMIGALPAAIEIVHGADNAPVRIGYTSDGVVEVVDRLGTVVQELPAAAQGGSASVPVDGRALYLRAAQGALISALELGTP